MRWLRPLLLFLTAGLSVCNARAADESSQPATLDLNNQMLASSGEQAAALLQSPWDNSRSAKRMHSYGVLEPDALEADANDNVCYTMRSYKVKRKERFADDERVRSGYSTCEKASNFHLRSADGDSQARPK